ncbi:MAG: protein kinase [Candidatus Aminicenantes bacterium]|nr:MAG: protein kinase [Candidatus Aminicenantes bacterium]
MDSDSILKAVLKKQGKKYQYKCFLGEGAYSKVYLANHTLFKEDHAIKVMDSTYLLQKLKKEDPGSSKQKFQEIKERFIVEARLYKKIDHPNIVKIHDIDVIENEREGVDIPYITMNYIKGASLKKVIKNEAPIEFRRAIRISKNILSALSTIHKKKIIHRDIKPGNIMIKDEGGDAILIDFGLAKDKLNETTLTKSEARLGTPQYMSCEQFKRPKELDHRTDIYSFGIVLFEMLVGEAPFEGDDFLKIMDGHCEKPIPNVKEKNPDLPAGIENIIFKAMAKDPNDRYETAKDFWNALNELEESQKIAVKENEKELDIEKTDEIIPQNEKKTDKIELIQEDKGKTEKGEKEDLKDLKIDVEGDDKTKIEKIEEEEKEEVEKDEKKELEKIKEKKDKKEKSKSSKKSFKYLVIFVFTIISAAIAAFIILNPYKPSREMKDTGKKIEPASSIITRQIENMKVDFENLKIFFKGEANKNEKLGKCREFLAKHQDLPENSEKAAMVSETNNFITQLQADIEKDKQYQKSFDAAKEYIKNVEYQKAIDELDKAKKIRETEEIATLSKGIREKQIEIEIMKEDFDNLKKFLEGGATKKEKKEECENFLEKHKNTPRDDVTRSIEKEANQFISQLKAEIRADEEYNAIKDNLNRSKYLEFKRKYPKSIHLPDLLNRLMRADKNLPPEKYWEKPIKRNKKGYYELTFGKEHNGHIMIYIPEKKIWIDKYEVSWAQFRKFSNDSKIKEDKFIRSGDELPAVVTYEDAQKYCKRYGLRLPGIDEWEYAAGKGIFTYPWGNESPNVPDVDGNWRANYDSLEKGIEKDGYDDAAPVKSFEKFSSPFGVVNMTGNVWEWVTGKILKGGGYLSSSKYIKNEVRIVAKNNDEGGFRCVKDEK